MTFIKTLLIQFFLLVYPQENENQKPKMKELVLFYSVIIVIAIFFVLLLH